MPDSLVDDLEATGSSPCEAMLLIADRIFPSAPAAEPAAEPTALQVATAQGARGRGDGCGDAKASDAGAGAGAGASCVRASGVIGVWRDGLRTEKLFACR